MAEKYQTTEGWRCEKKTSNHRRAHWLDYQDPAILLLTLVTTDRLPLLGHLQGADIVRTTLGQHIAEEIERIPTYKEASAIEIYNYVIMPDHVHILLRIHERLPKHLGRYISWFKRQCTLIYNQLSNKLGELAPSTRQEVDGVQISTTNQADSSLVLGANSPSNKVFPFCPEYHDRILTHKGQLMHMVRYIQDNPRRLALKRANKELFKIQQDVHLNNLPCTTLGNIFLADYPVKQVVQCSRRLSQEQIDEQKTLCMSNAEQGVVHITAAISEGEKQIARALRESGYPLIILLQDGFPDPDNPHYRYFKPQGVYFEACAMGKLLLVEPHRELLDREDIAARTEAKVGHIPHDSQRYRFVAMNMIAEELAKGFSSAMCGESGHDLYKFLS